MSAAGWFALVGSLVVVLGLWIAFTASRLDRLHARLDAAQSALDAQLVRRVAALRHAVEVGPAGPVLTQAERERIEAVTQAALVATGDDRLVAENEVGRTVTDLAVRAVPLSPAQRDELH